MTAISDNYVLVPGSFLGISERVPEGGTRLVRILFKEGTELTLPPGETNVARHIKEEIDADGRPVGVWVPKRYVTEEFG